MVINDGERISRAESDYKKLPPLYSSDREIKHPPFQETFLFDLKRKKENKVLARTRGRKRKEYHLLGSFISNNCARFDFPLIIIPPGIPLEPFVQSHPPKLYRLIELRHQLQIQPRNNQFERRANVEQVWGGGWMGANQRKAISWKSRLAVVKLANIKQEGGGRMQKGFKRCTTCRNNEQIFVSRDWALFNVAWPRLHAATGPPHYLEFPISSVPRSTRSCSLFLSAHNVPLPLIPSCRNICVYIKREEGGES